MMYALRWEVVGLKARMVGVFELGLEQKVWTDP